MTSTLDALRAEYEQDGIGQLLYALINHVVARTVTRYPPAIYSPDRGDRWTPDARGGVAHAWAVARLLGPRRRLERYLDEASTVEQLERRLAGDLRDHLVDALAPDGARTMRRRVLDVLATLDGARCISSRPGRADAIWVLTDRDDATAPAARRALERQAWEVPDERLDLLRDHHPAMRTTPLIRTTGIEALVGTLLTTAGAARTGDLVAAVCSRLQLPDPGRLPESLDADERGGGHVADADADLERWLDEAERERLAAGVFATLPDDVRTRVAAYARAGENEVAAAAALGVDRRTIRRARDPLRASIVAAAGNDVEAAIKIYDLVLTRLVAWHNEAGSPGEER